MEEVKQSAVNSEQSTVEQKTPNSFLVILLSSLLIISCFIAGFFAYQTQKLVKELTVYRLQPTETPVPTPTPDPTADWKMYTNEEYGFSIKHPLTTNEKIFIPGPIGGIVKQIQTFSELDPKFEGDIKIFNGLTLYSVSNTSQVDLETYVDKQIQSLISKYSIEKNVTKKLTSFDNSKSYSVELANNFTLYYIQIPESDDFIVISVGHLSYSTNPFWITSDQILSTFKFTEPEASSSPLPVACTMEAKLCPDGSYVGRTGPKCEFAPCP